MDLRDAAEPANETERRRWNDPSWIRSWLGRERITAAVTEALVATAALASGERVLDVGTGTGPLALEAARRVGPAGSVLGVDLSEQLAALARRRAAESGDELGPLDFVVADAQTEKLPGGPFDVALSQFGVMFFDDPVAAFSNLRRHLRPGGRLAFACWQPVAVNPWFTGPVLRRFLPEPEPRPPGAITVPGPFALGDAGLTASILAGSGFASLAHQERSSAVRAPAGALLAEDDLAFYGVPEEQHVEALQAVRDHLERFAVPGGYELPIAYTLWSAAAP